MTELSFVLDGYRPGALAQALRLHMDYYGPEWGLGKNFETYCAGGMADFLSQFDADRDLFVAAWDSQGNMLGAVTLDGRDYSHEGARLRWFIVDGAAQGSGVGRRLLDEVMGFCRAKGFERICLSTFAGLDSARHLYESVGFRLIEERTDDPWDSGTGEQVFRYDKGDDSRTEKLG